MTSAWHRKPPNRPFVTPHLFSFMKGTKGCLWVPFGSVFMLIQELLLCLFSGWCSVKPFMGPHGPSLVTFQAILGTFWEMHHRFAGGRQVCVPAWGWQPMHLCPWLHMKTSPAISARQPTLHTQWGGRAESKVHQKKKKRPGRKQSPPKCVSPLWKTREESELSTLVASFSKTTCHYGVTEIDPEWVSGDKNTNSDSVTNWLCDFGYLPLFVSYYPR